MLSRTPADDITALSAVVPPTESTLQEALERGELELHYQPMVSLQASSVVALESLMRWNHPERGVLEPNQFFPQAEASDAMVELGAWALGHACAQLHNWRPLTDGQTLRIAVNVSGAELHHPALFDSVVNNLARHRVRPDELILEVTESAVADEDPQARATLTALEELGVLIAVDDFGTGSASLAQLRRFRADLLKIDGQFVAELGKDDSAPGFVSALTMLGHALGMTVVAEGVETREQLALLRDLGFDLVQGFLFAAPAPSEDIARVLALAGI